MSIVNSRDDYLCIGGKRLALHDLVNRRLFDADYVQSLRAEMHSAQPFQHLVIDGAFHPFLLELASEEFETLDSGGWRFSRDEQHLLRRSVVGAKMGPALQLYFGLINSGWFLEFLSSVSGVHPLIVDSTLHNGGLHETGAGGSFGIHRDFDRHPKLGLHNEIGVITYLNKDWDASWQGALELWDSGKKQCVRRIEPEFGRSVVIRHSSVSFHGHPAPLKIPDRMARRSLASYYYGNRIDDNAQEPYSTYLFSREVKNIKHTMKLWTPPIVWHLVQRIRSSRGRTAQTRTHVRSNDVES
jgi:hypothetical protein